MHACPQLSTVHYDKDDKDDNKNPTLVFCVGLHVMRRSLIPKATCADRSFQKLFCLFKDNYGADNALHHGGGHVENAIVRRRE